MSLDVIEMVRERLKSDGYDGLVADGGECACLVDDLAPCSDMKADCSAGHRGPCDPADCAADGNCDFHIIRGRKP